MNQHYYIDQLTAMKLNDEMRHDLDVLSSSLFNCHMETGFINNS